MVLARGLGSHYRYNAIVHTVSTILVSKVGIVYLQLQTALGVWFGDILENIKKKILYN
jgi:hypothetical protein